MTNNIELRGCDSAMTRQVIVTKALKGSGKENDPYREVTQYWSLTGKLLFEADIYMCANQHEQWQQCRRQRHYAQKC